MFRKLFGKRNDDTVMADAEEQEYRIDNSFFDLQTKRFVYEQMQEEQRQRHLAEYSAEKKREAEGYQAMKAEQAARAAQVRANGGRWIALSGNRYIDGDGNIVYSSDLA